MSLCCDFATLESDVAILVRMFGPALCGGRKTRETPKKVAKQVRGSLQDVAVLSKDVADLQRTLHKKHMNEQAMRSAAVELGKRLHRHRSNKELNAIVQKPRSVLKKGIMLVGKAIKTRQELKAGSILSKIWSGLSWVGRKIAAIFSVVVGFVRKHWASVAVGIVFVYMAGCALYDMLNPDAVYKKAEKSFFSNFSMFDWFTTDDSGTGHYQASALKFATGNKWCALSRHATNLLTWMITGDSEFAPSYVRAQTQRTAASSGAASGFGAAAGCAAATGVGAAFAAGTLGAGVIVAGATTAFACGGIGFTLQSASVQHQIEREYASALTTGANTLAVAVGLPSVGAGIAALYSIFDSKKKIMIKAEAELSDQLQRVAKKKTPAKKPPTKNTKKAPAEKKKAPAKKKKAPAEKKKAPAEKKKAPAQKKKKAPAKKQKKKKHEPR